MKKLSRAAKTDIFTYLLATAGFLAAQCIQGAGLMSSSLKGQLVPICAYVVMAISLNLTVGILGELSLGHAGFMSIGSFSGVVAAVALEPVIPAPEIRLASAMVIGAVCAGGAGILIGVPVLRLRGDYLAIVTLAFGEIVLNLTNCLYVGTDSQGLHISMLTSAEALGLASDGRVIINGPVGASGITRLSSFTAGFILILITLFIVQNLVNSRTGRAILAVRDNRISAESVGISVTKHKMIAFVLSAVLAGAAGVLFALNMNTIVPTKFNFNTSILILVFVVLGGLGKIWGSIIAAAVLTVLPEALRGFSNYRMLAYAIVLILIMLLTNSPFIKSVLGRMRVPFNGRRNT
ncbi:MAG: branched-chain amino acid ABC transporter permease [Clostridiales bacterium]|jgi:branched-chain amino acid transport system permease protein|nr:branched-chain amino acid ABC transporter permease [Clostridiales bacterium]